MSTVLDYAGPVTLGLLLLLWAAHVPYVDRLLSARLGA